MIWFEMVGDGMISYHMVGGWGVTPTGNRIRFVRACVRAGEARRDEAVCARETRCLLKLGGGNTNSHPARRVGGVPFPFAIGM